MYFELEWTPEKMTLWWALLVFAKKSVQEEEKSEAANESLDLSSEKEKDRSKHYWNNF